MIPLVDMMLLPEMGEAKNLGALSEEGLQEDKAARRGDEIGERQ